MMKDGQDTIERIALDPAVKEDDVRMVAQRNGWRRTHDLPASDDGPREVVWSAPGACAVHFMDDPFIGLRYVVVEGPAARVQALAAVIRSSLPVFGYQEAARALAPGARGNRAEDMLRTAVAAPLRYDERFHTLLLSGLRHADAAVRRATIIGLSYVGWPEFRADLDRLRASDPDSDVRQDATALLQGYERFGVTENSPEQPFLGRPGDGSDTDAAPPRLRLVFREHVDRDAMRDFAAARGWTAAGEREEDAEAHVPLELAWRTGSGSAVHYVDDSNLEDGNVVLYTCEMPFLVLEGERLDAVEQAVRDAFPVYDAAQVRARLAGAVDVDDRTAAITVAAYAAPPAHDPAWAALLVDELRHENVWVRLAAVYAIGGVEWPEMIPVLEQAAQADAETVVRETASEFLDATGIATLRDLIDVLDGPGDG